MLLLYNKKLPVKNLFSEKKRKRVLSWKMAKLKLKVDKIKVQEIISLVVPSKVGFTLIEMLVVIGILAIIFGSSVSALRRGERLNYLENDVDQLVSVLKRAQVMSLTGREIAGTRPTSFGVYLNSSKDYLLFAEFTNTLRPYLYDSGSDVTMETIKLSTNNQFTASGDNIAFAVPLGSVYLNGSQTGGLTITLTSNELSTSSDIVINAQTGRIGRK